VTAAGPDDLAELAAQIERAQGDPDELGRLAAKLRLAWIADDLDTTGFAEAMDEGERRLALVLKRTYRIGNHRAEPAAPDDEELLQEHELPYDPERASPLVSPPVFVNEARIRRRRTDVVVQAIAYAYAKGTRELTARVRFGEHERSIVVHGARRGEIDRAGRPRFSEAEPIEGVPLRYDFAYGGVDQRALEKRRDPLRAILAQARYDFDPQAVTDYHYPRNPCGLGYLIDLDEEGFDGLPIPFLEHPFDPLSPARLAVGDPKRWARGPLPACWDWQSETWFPRLGYLGMAPDVDDPDLVPEEARRGWAARDVLRIPPVHHAPDRPISPEFDQCASPGMSIAELSPAETFVLTNLHPNKPTYSFQLPGEVPEVKLDLGGPSLTDLEPHLDAVVVRPDPGELVMLWSARTTILRSYTFDELAGTRRVVRWARIKER